MDEKKTNEKFAKDKIPKEMLLEQIGSRYAAKLIQQAFSPRLSDKERYNRTCLAVFAVMMKYLDDNHKKFNLEIPDILRFSILSRLADEIPGERLQEFLRQILSRLDAEHVPDEDPDFLYHELERCGLEDDAPYMTQLFQVVGEQDLSDEFGTKVATRGITNLINEMEEQDRHSGLLTVPMKILDLLNGISGIVPGMNCYNVTDDFGMTLSVLTQCRQCGVTVHTDENHFAVTIMVLLVATEMGQIRVFDQPVSWLPAGEESTMGDFDRVYAVPPFAQRIKVEQAIMEAGCDPAPFIEWYPEDLSCGEWLYARHMLKALKPDGVGYIVLPLGRLSGMERKNENVRKRILESNVLDSVIEFPPGTFSKTMVKTALLIIKKNRSSDKVFMVDYSGNAKSAFLPETILERKTTDFVSREVTREEIRGNGYSFSPSAYIQNKIDIKDMADDLDIAVKEGEKLEKKYRLLCKSYEAAIRIFLEGSNQKKADDFLLEVAHKRSQKITKHF